MVSKVHKLFKKCDKFVKIADLEFPAVKIISNKALSEGKRINKILVVELIRKYRQKYLRSIFVAIKANRRVSLRKKTV